MMLYNFWIMDVTVTAMVLLSAMYGEKTRRNGQSTKAEYPLCDGGEVGSGKQTDSSLGMYLFLNFSYFAAMGFTVVILQYYPSIMICLQHIAVICFIVIAFAQWLPPRCGYAAGVLFSVAWLLSVETTLRWHFNNLIITMFAFLASHVHFRNFAFLQIFLWTALIYDVCLLARMNDTPQAFSVGACSNLLCQLFEMNNAWELPSVFTVRFGETDTHVFLGTGDIVIGAIISNFAMSFFRSARCLVGVVCSYGLAIALLSQVDSNQPYPALLSIVPCCSTALILCAVFCRKTRRLFSLNFKESDSIRDEELIVIWSKVASRYIARDRTETKTRISTEVECSKKKKPTEQENIGPCTRTWYIS